MEEDVVYLNDKITLADLIASETKVTKKIVIVNSSKYTDEAFDYILELADQNESIVFVADLRQIYTHGCLYGGDVFEDSLKSFTKFVVANQDGEVVGTLLADSPNDAIQFMGEGGIQITPTYDALTDTSTMHIDYNLHEAIDETAVVEISNTIKLALKVEDNKIQLNKYEGADVEFGEVRVLEYDSVSTFIGIKLKLKDPNKLTFIKVTASNGLYPSYDSSTYTINAMIPTNMNVTIYVDYIYDGVRGSMTTKQLWGYGWYAGIDDINENNFEALPKNFEDEFKEKEITITQPTGYYAWFAYPKSAELIFTDVDTGIAGGWKKIGNFTKYSLGIEYQTYRTVNSGLGSVTWRITKKQK